MNTNKKIIINILITVVFAIIAVVLFTVVHQCRVLEMQTQIEQLGFYKEDVVLLIDNNYKLVWSSIGGIVSAVICLCVWIDLF